ncbi:nucleotidyltransferase domain-containing protein [Candidatus Pacearchaeota archaeon]|nr:nucleotidyltransferase domain-containing protein [Candidatus Pacearchaeota archaeon]
MGDKKKKIPIKRFPTLNLIDEKEIALDFAAKVYQKFDKIIKSVFLFGSQAKNSAVSGSDIDIVIVIDDASVQWDQELIAWYREELGKIIRANPYKKELHINSVKLTNWWQDLMRGDPVVINMLRFGEPLIDFGGFFTPQKILLEQGKIRSTPEAIYNALQRTPGHLARSRGAVLSSIEGLYWASVDSAHAALMAAKQVPPSPEQIPIMLKEIFVDTGKLRIGYVSMCRDLYVLHKHIIHGDLVEIKGNDIDEWRDKVEKFTQEMIRLVREIIEHK